jgi:hypothetical protein
MGEDEVFDLMMSIMNPSVSNYERNLTTLGYADLGVPVDMTGVPRLAHNFFP